MPLNWSLISIKIAFVPKYFRFFVLKNKTNHGCRKELLRAQSPSVFDIVLQLIQVPFWKIACLFLFPPSGFVLHINYRDTYRDTMLLSWYVSWYKWSGDTQLYYKLHCLATNCCNLILLNSCFLKNNLYLHWNSRMWKVPGESQPREGLELGMIIFSLFILHQLGNKF